jgi:DNA-binding NtrC family response regulator
MSSAPGIRRGSRTQSHLPVSIVGSSPGLLAAVELATRVAPTNMPVLIVGETGTGKELLAQLIHELSGRDGLLVPIDCGTLPEELVESLLFGHRRGAFTGAFEHVRGLIAEADHGTLFLDELGSLSARGQAKLLRVLETGAVRRVGDVRSRIVGFRLVATAQPALSRMLVDGHFRDDLVQRVAGVVIELPALRERGEDVLLLARHFAEAEGLVLEEEAAAMLATRDWRGNVRELKSMVLRSALFATGQTIDRRAVAIAVQVGLAGLGNGGAGVDETAGVAALSAICRRCGGDPDLVAQALGTSRSGMYRRLKRAGLRLETFRDAGPGWTRLSE